MHRIEWGGVPAATARKAMMSQSQKSRGEDSPSSRDPTANSKVASFRSYLRGQIDSGCFGLLERMVFQIHPCERGQLEGADGICECLLVARFIVVDSYKVDPIGLGANDFGSTLNASVYAARLEWLKADKSLRTAWALAENDAFTRTQHGLVVALAAGHIRQAEEEIRAAHRQAPADAIVALRLAVVIQVAGSRDAEAMHYMDLAIDLGFPKALSPVPIMYGLAAVREQRYTEAADYMVQDLRVRTWAAEHAVRLALNVLDTGGDKSQAIAALREVEQRADPRRLAYEGLSLICWLYTWLGAIDCAYEAAHRTLDEMARTGPVWFFPGSLWAPQMQAFRLDPRFQALVTRLGLMRYWEEYGPPDNCELRDGHLICH